MAVLAVIQFYNALKKDLKHHKPLAKFLAFKLIIFVTFLQKVCLISDITPSTLQRLLQTRDSHFHLLTTDRLLDPPLNQRTQRDIQTHFRGRQHGH